MDTRCEGLIFFRFNRGLNIYHFQQACFKVSDVQANIRNTGMSAVRSVLGSFSYDQVNTKRQCCISAPIFYRSLVTAMNLIEDSIRSSVIRLQYVFVIRSGVYNADYRLLFLSK